MPTRGRALGRLRPRHGGRFSVGSRCTGRTGSRSATSTNRGTSVRVLLALGGNAMTAPTAAPRPEAQRAADRGAMAAVAGLVAAGARGRAHPRQRPAGRQPAGQERARRRRRAAGAAGLVRRPDPGHASASSCSTRSSAALAARRRRPAGGRDRDPHPGRRGRPRLRPARPSRSAATCRTSRPSCSIEHGETWEDRGEKGWRRVVASPEPRRDASTTGRCVTLSTPATSSSRPAAAASRSCATPDGGCRGVEAVIDKDLTAALLARTVEADVLVIATDVDHAVLGFGTPEAEADRHGRRWRRCAASPPRATSPAARWGPRSRRPAGSSSTVAAER